MLKALFFIGSNCLAGGLVTKYLPPPTEAEMKSINNDKRWHVRWLKKSWLGCRAGVVHSIIGQIFIARSIYFLLPEQAAGMPVEYPQFLNVSPLKIIICKCLLGPVVEEIAFRGMLAHMTEQSATFLVADEKKAKELGKSMALSIGLLFFAAAHQSWEQRGAVAYLGFVSSYLREKTQKDECWFEELIAPIAFHMTWNALVQFAVDPWCRTTTTLTGQRQLP